MHNMSPARLLLSASAIVGIALSVYGTAFSQDEPQRVTLDQAMSLLWQNNPELDLVRLRMLEQEGKVRQATALHDPVADVVWEPLFGGADMQSELTVQLSQKILWPGLRGARQEAASAFIDVARNSAKADSMRLSSVLVQTYVQASAASERIRELELLVEVYREAESWVQSQVAEGESAGYSLRRLRLEKGMLESRVAGEKAEFVRLQRTLAGLIYPTGSPGLVAPLTGIDSLADVPSLDSLLMMAESNRAEILLTRSHIAAEESALALVHAELSPAPTVSVGFKHQSEGRNGPVVGLSLPLPVLDRRTGDLEAGEARIEAAGAQLDITRQAVRNDLQKSYDAFRGVSARVGKFALTINSDADVMLNAAKVGYREGEMSLTELLDAIETYREARILLINLRGERQIAYFDLQRAAGCAFSTTDWSAP